MNKTSLAGIMLTMLLVGMLTSVFNIQQVNAEPEIWTVDDNGPADFSTIQEAINFANNGDTILVSAGIYYEHVIVNKSVTVLGESRDNTIIDGRGTGPVINITQNNVQLKNFTIQNGEDWPYIDVWVCSSNNNYITENSLTAVLLYNSSWNEISSNRMNGLAVVTNSQHNTISANQIKGKIILVSVLDSIPITIRFHTIQ